MPFKKNNPGSCDSCGEPVICPERPGVNMYLRHTIEDDPGVIYISLIVGTYYKWTIPDPSEGDGLMIGVDGNRTLWIVSGEGKPFADYDFSAWWIDRYGNTGSYDLKTEWSLGVAGDITRYQDSRDDLVFAVGGDGFWVVIREIDSSDSTQSLYVGHVTTSSEGLNLLTSTEVGELSGSPVVESLGIYYVIGCHSSATVFVHRNMIATDTYPLGWSKLQVWFNGAISEEWSGDFGSAPSVVNRAIHFYADYVMATLSFSGDFTTYLFNEGGSDSSGIFPVNQVDPDYVEAFGTTSYPGRYSHIPIAIGQGVVWQPGATEYESKLFDIDGAVQDITVVDLDNAGNHLRREYYSQNPLGTFGVHGNPEFNETNIITTDSDSGEISWPEEFLPDAFGTTLGIDWVDFYYFPNSAITSLLPISEIT